MKRPAVFFDRDNTLIVSNDYLDDPAKVVLMDGAGDAVAKARQYGFKVLTFSNQSGVARGLFDEETVQAVNARMDELLQAANPAAKIASHEYCPDHPEGTVEKYRKESPRRKPQPGMLLDAARQYKLDLSRSWVIGDAPRDIEAGHAAGCRTILFRDPNVAASPAADAPSDIKADFTVTSLKEAVELIGREAFKQPPPAPRVSRSDTSEAQAAGTNGPAPSSAPREAPPPSSNGSRHEPPPARATPPTERSRVMVVDEDDPELPELPPRRRAAMDAEGDADAAALSRGSNVKIQQLLLQILLELKRQRGDRAEFLIPKLLAGVTQVLSVSLLVVGLFSRSSPSLQPMLLYAIALQVMTIALLIMGKQR